MHIGIVGGVERGEQRYAAAAASQGHSFEFHGGDMAGRGSDSLEALVLRSRRRRERRRTLTERNLWGFGCSSTSAARRR